MRKNPKSWRIHGGHLFFYDAVQLFFFSLPGFVASRSTANVCTHARSPSKPFSTFLLFYFLFFIDAMNSNMYCPIIDKLGNYHSKCKKMVE
jgi:hypothetical protein